MMCSAPTAGRENHLRVPSGIGGDRLFGEPASDVVGRLCLIDHAKLSYSQIMAKTPKPQPSKARAVWLYAEREPKPLYDPALVGKWNVFVPRTAVDKVWAALADATERGELGISAKVSASLSNPNAHDPNSHVVILYAADWRDIEELRRMLRRIREAEIKQSVYFKRDIETLSGKYSTKNKPTVSVWGSPSGDMIRTKWVGSGKVWVEVTPDNREAIVAQIEEQDALA